MATVVERFRVMRQDDNGNQYVIADKVPADLANEMVRQLELSDHKQIYWMEETK